MGYVARDLIREYRATGDSEAFKQTTLNAYRRLAISEFEKEVRQIHDSVIQASVLDVLIEDLASGAVTKKEERKILLINSLAGIAVFSACTYSGLSELLTLGLTVVSVFVTSHLATKPYVHKKLANVHIIIDAIYEEADDEFATSEEK